MAKSEMLSKKDIETHTGVVVGSRLRHYRVERGLSLRVLAGRSGLSINTLSLIENGRSSPSVSTLHLLALALDLPITKFFESDPFEKNVVFTPVDRRPLATFGSTRMQNLSKDLAGNGVQSFVVTLQPGMGSGTQMIVHTGHELVYCLKGSICYRINQDEYTLTPGDSLTFEAHLPHCWENCGNQEAEILLVLIPADAREEPGGRHFSIQTLKKEINMKIAVITDNGKTISQHFGRALYYLVLTIEDGKIVNRETREKLGHHQFGTGAHAEYHHGVNHGHDGEAHSKHATMAEAIADCKALICGGMGMGAYDSLKRLNIQPIVTNISDIETAAEAFIDGKLIDHTELLH